MAIPSTPWWHLRVSLTKTTAKYQRHGRATFKVLELSFSLQTRALVSRTRDSRLTAPRIIHGPHRPIKRSLSLRGFALTGLCLDRSLRTVATSNKGATLGGQSIFGDPYNIEPKNCSDRPQIQA